MRPPKPGSLLVIVLSCPQIGSLSNSTANQRAAQNNYWTLGLQDLYFLNFVTCNAPYSFLGKHSHLAIKTNFTFKFFRRVFFLKCLNRFRCTFLASFYTNFSVFNEFFEQVFFKEFFRWFFPTIWLNKKVFYDVSNNTIGQGILMLTWPNSL